MNSKVQKDKPRDSGVGDLGGGAVVAAEEQVTLAGSNLQVNQEQTESNRMATSSRTEEKGLKDVRLKFRGDEGDNLVVASAAKNYLDALSDFFQANKIKAEDAKVRESYLRRFMPPDSPAFKIWDTWWNLNEDWTPTWPEIEDAFRQRWGLKKKKGVYWKEKVEKRLAQKQNQTIQEWYDRCLEVETLIKTQGAELVKTECADICDKCRINTIRTFMDLMVKDSFIGGMSGPVKEKMIDLEEKATSMDALERALKFEREFSNKKQATVMLTEPRQENSLVTKEDLEEAMARVLLVTSRQGKKGGQGKSQGAGSSGQREKKKTTRPDGIRISNMKEGYCYNCGLKGHMIRDCKVKPENMDWNKAMKECLKPGSMVVHTPEEQKHEQLALTMEPRTYAVTAGQEMAKAVRDNAERENNPGSSVFGPY